MKAHWCIGIFILMTLAACATKVGTIPGDHAPDASKGIVLGRIVVNGPKVAFFDKQSSFKLKAKNRTTGEEFEIAAAQEGSDSYYIVELPAGSYSITELKKHGNKSRPPAHFEIRENQVNYVGTLHFNKGPLWTAIAASIAAGSAKVMGAWAVEDDYPAAAEHFSRRFPHIDRKPIRTLMELRGSPG